MSEVDIDAADSLDGDHPAAVLWDMDGTLVDTEPYWIAEERALVELHGGVWTDEHAYQLVGNDLMVSAQYIIDHAPIPLTPVEVVRRAARRRGPPGARARAVAAGRLGAARGPR